MGSYLDRLKSVFAARTPGPLSYRPENKTIVCNNEEYCSKHGGLLASLSYIKCQDALFFALTGTIADEMLAVVEIAQGMWRACPNANPDPCGRCDFCDLDRALAALRAKCDGVT